MRAGFDSLRSCSTWLVGVWFALHVNPAVADGVLRNPFNDPFVQVANGLAGCPVPEVPIYDEAEYRQLAHDRAQRGVSCWLAGRCRLYNAYLYDAEIIPRVQKAILATGKFGDTSIWALGQRRRVRLKGCVRTAVQARELEAIVRDIDDVEGVDNELMIGVRGKPPYAVRGR
jgi:hypothetical protein